MALNFIKKVFSFGRNKEDAPAPDTEDTATDRKTEPNASAAAPGEAIPGHAEHPATSEAAPDQETVSTPAPESEPEDQGRAGEPPTLAPAARDKGDSSDKDVDEVPAEGLVMPEDLISDPATSIMPDPDARPVPAQAETAETEASQDRTGKGAGGGEGDGWTAPEDIVSDPMTQATPDPASPNQAPTDPTLTDPAAPSGPEVQQQPEPRRLVVRDTVSTAEPEAAPVPAEPQGRWWQRLRQGLSRTSGQLSGQITGIFTKRKLDEQTLEDLEDVLLQADLGVETALRITDALASGRYGRDISPAEVQKVMADEISKALGPVARPLELDLSHKPHVILVVGVNGTGKTTTIGKLAAKLSAGGLKVTLAAGDTFRAAAIEQLRIWGERTGSEVVATRLGADAAGLAYEAIERARQNNSDVVIIDTAGRLQNKAELMDELAKVVRVIGKLHPDAPHTVLQTLDATTGQNALNQVEIFRNVAGVNGLVMTKLDGTARGGILVAIAARHKLPVYFIGVGEGVDDLEPFEAADFASAIAGEPA